MIRIAAVAAVVATLGASAAWAEPSSFGGQVTGLIDKACHPLIKGQELKAVAAAAGMKRSGGDLVLQLQGSQKIVLSPPTQANPNVCILALQYEVNGTQGVVDALTGWAAAQTPPIPELNAAYKPAPGLTGWSWSVDTGPVQAGLVFTARRTPDDKPVGRDYDVGTVLFSYRGAAS